MKIDWFDSEKYFFTDESVTRQITDSISENLTDSDLESTEKVEECAIGFLKSIKCLYIHMKYRFWIFKSTVTIFMASIQIHLMPALCMGLPSMFVFEFPSTNRTSECRFLSTFNSNVILQRSTPQIVFSTLKADPWFLQTSWKI